VTPPTWLDEHGQPRATRPCPACGREIAVVTLPPEHLRFWGWHPLRLSGYVEWCGHRVEGIPVPDADGRWRLIVVEGEANCTRP
jgi:hypothetical protein